MMSTGLYSKKREELSSQPSLPSNDYKISHLMTPVIQQYQQARDSKTSGSMGNLPMPSQLSNSFAHRQSHPDHRFDHMSQQEMPSIINRQSNSYSVENHSISVNQSISQKFLKQSAQQLLGFIPQSSKPQGLAPLGANEGLQYAKGANNGSQKGMVKPMLGPIRVQNNEVGPRVSHSRSQLTTSLNSQASNMVVPVKAAGEPERQTIQNDGEGLQVPMNNHEILPSQVTFSDFKDQGRQLRPPAKDLDAKHVDTQSQPDHSIERSSLQMGSIQAHEDANSMRRNVVRERKIGSTDATVDKRIRRTLGQQVAHPGGRDHPQEQISAYDIDGHPPNIGSITLADEESRSNR